MWLKMFLQVKLQYLLRLNLLHCRHWVMLAATVDGCCTSCCPAFKVLGLSILAHWRCLLGAIHILKIYKSEVKSKQVKQVKYIYIALFSLISIHSLTTEG